MMDREIVATVTSAAPRFKSGRSGNGARASRESDELDRRVSLPLAVSNRLMEQAELLLATGEPEGAAQSLRLAAVALAQQNQMLSSDRLERNLRAVAALIGNRTAQPSTVTSAPVGERPVYLHVADRVLPYGGHTAMARRWIQHTSRSARHDVLLLDQTMPVPADLVAVVTASGGRIAHLARNDSILNRAAELREISWQTSNYVVLHVDSQNIVPAIAFGLDVGPPVMLVNHAAHAYWTCGSIADVILNCRGSALELEWTQAHRGYHRSSILPIPLDYLSSSAEDEKHARRSRIRREFAIADTDLLIISVGDNYKYAELPGLNFAAGMAELLRGIPGAQLLVIGVDPDRRWREASSRCAGRLRAIGRRHDINCFHAAADLYIEGYPFGSTTALLEAGLAGLPVVLAPATCPPPYGSDGVAIDDVLRRPEDIADYHGTIERLSRDGDARGRLAHTFQASVMAHHVGAGWMAYLARMLERLPDSHRVQDVAVGSPIHSAHSRRWDDLQRYGAAGPQKCLEALVRVAMKERMPYGICQSALDLAAEYRGQLYGRSIPGFLLKTVWRSLYPTLPAVTAIGVLDFLRESCREGSRTMRMLQRMIPRWLW